MTATLMPNHANFIPTDLRDDAPFDLPELVELSVILPHWQMDALEVEARDRGVTTGQMLRRLIGEYFVAGRKPINLATPA